MSLRRNRDVVSLCDFDGGAGGLHVSETLMQSKKSDPSRSFDTSLSWSHQLLLSSRIMTRMSTLPTLFEEIGQLGLQNSSELGMMLCDVLDVAPSDFSLFMFGASTDHLVEVERWELDEDGQFVVSTLPIEWAAYEEILTEPLRQDAHNTPLSEEASALLSTLFGSGALHLLSLPLYVGGRGIGALHLRFEEDMFPEPSEVGSYIVIGQALASEIERAKWHRAALAQGSDEELIQQLQDAQKEATQSKQELQVFYTELEGLRQKFQDAQTRTEEVVSALLSSEELVQSIEAEKQLLQEQLEEARHEILLLSESLLQQKQAEEATSTPAASSEKAPEFEETVAIMASEDPRLMSLRNAAAEESQEPSEATSSVEIFQVQQNLRMTTEFEDVPIRDTSELLEEVKDVPAEDEAEEVQQSFNKTVSLSESRDLLFDDNELAKVRKSVSHSDEEQDALSSTQDLPPEDDSFETQVVDDAAMQALQEVQEEPPNEEPQLSSDFIDAYNEAPEEPAQETEPKSGVHELIDDIDELSVAVEESPSSASVSTEDDEISEVGDMDILSSSELTAEGLGIQDLIYYTEKQLAFTPSFLEMLRSMLFRVKVLSTPQELKEGIMDLPAGVILMPPEEEGLRAEIATLVQRQPRELWLPLLNTTGVPEEGGGVEFVWGKYRSAKLDEDFWYKWLESVRARKHDCMVLSIGIDAKEEAGRLLEFCCGVDVDLQVCDEPAQGIQYLYQAPPHLLILHIGDFQAPWAFLFSELGRSVRTREVPLLLISEQPLSEDLLRSLNDLNYLLLIDNANL